MFSKAHLLAMLELQTKMNVKVNPNWLDAGYPFLRAAVVEGGEALEHASWKWWKSQRRDIAQLQMEIVDIFHFYLSAVMIDHRGHIHKSADFIFDRIKGEDNIEFDGKNYSISGMDLLTKLELLIGLSVSRRISIPLFGAILTDCGMAWPELYLQYVGKHILNIFRQDNDYSGGGYRKEWDGREDNEHLTEILALLDHNSPDFHANIYKELNARYTSQRFP